MVIKGDWQKIMSGPWGDKIQALMVLLKVLQRGVIITLLDSSEDEENKVKAALQKIGLEVR